MTELKHSHNKLRKYLQDKSTELVHALRRGEQYDAEVRKLRHRIDEIKQQYAKAEDQVDQASNTIRSVMYSLM